MCNRITDKISQVCKNFDTSRSNATRTSSESSDASSVRSRRSAVSFSSYDGNMSPFARMFDNLVMEGSSIPPTPSPTLLDSSRQHYERPSCPTPNSRSDLSTLLKRRISQTPPSSGKTKQRRPTPVVYHFIESESLKEGTRRKISPAVQRMRSRLCFQTFTV